MRTHEVPELPNAARALGIAAWQHIDDRPLLLGYDNPWLRRGLLALGLVASALAIGVLGEPAGIVLPILGLLGFVGGVLGLLALQSYLGERQIGALQAEIHRDYLAVGCANDRLVIPWSAIDVGRAPQPRAGAMSIPIAVLGLPTIQVQLASGARRSWDRRPYARFILDVRWNGEQGALEIGSRPAAFQQQLRRLVYPMLGVLVERAATPRATDGSVANGAGRRVAATPAS